jgi:tetratricopeptide (TPR) repeat protein
MRNWQFKKIIFLFSIIVLNNFYVYSQDAETINSANNYYESGVFFYSNSSYDNAIAAFKKCNNLIQNPTTWYYLGLCYKSKQEWQNALDAMENALTFPTPRLLEKFKEDAKDTQKKSRDALRGVIINSGSGQALSMATVVPGKQDNPFPTLLQNHQQHIFKLINDRIILPGMGVRNENQTIGDFCCTGETATILREGNIPVGYIYFYGVVHATATAAQKLQILVSAVPSISNPNSDRVKDEIDFDAARELFNNATKSKIVGSLKFTVTILSVRTTGQSFFDDGLRIQIDIYPVQ